MVHVPPVEVPPAVQEIKFVAEVSVAAGEREVIALRVILDLDPADAGRVLGISPSACTTRLSRALGRLEEKVGSQHVA